MEELKNDVNYNESAQELYNALYEEVIRRYRITGAKPPSEPEIFKALVQFARSQVVAGEFPEEIMDMLAEVKPQVAREREEARRMEEREKALREGTVLDLDDLLK